MSDRTAHPYQAHSPTRFVERGVAAPLTTPHLLGARVRASWRGGIDYLLPSLAGTSGVYVLDWAGVCARWSPTLHDRMLHQRLPSSGPITPTALRSIALRIAGEGLAGRPARAAAARRLREDEETIVLTSFLLLLSLLEQSEPDGTPVSEATPRTPALEQRAKRIVARIAPGLGRDPAEIADDLDALAVHFAAAGVEPVSPRPRLARLVSRMRAARQSLLTHGDDSGAPIALAEVITLHAGLAERLIDAIRAPIADMPALLRRWSTHPAEVAERASRLEWVLDGWDQLCLVWETADSPALRHLALREMTLMAPSLPAEILDWIGPNVLPKNRLLSCRPTPASPDLRGAAAAFRMVGRSERLRALLS